jgi:hypothetical protein
MDKRIISLETLYKILNNPLIFDEHAAYDNIRNIDDFLNIVIDLKNKKEYSKERVLLDMFNYAQLYNKYRPIRITKNNIYFGTVKKMNSIFATIFKYYDSELLITFSNIDIYDEINFKNSKKKEYDDINWDDMISDIREINAAILFTAEENSVELYNVMQNDSPYFVQMFIKKYITRIIEGITEEDIKFDGKDKIVIKNNILIINENCSLRYAIHNIKIKNK